MAFYAFPLINMRAAEVCILRDSRDRCSDDSGSSTDSSKNGENSTSQHVEFETILLEMDGYDTEIEARAKNGDS
jgi:hypothetical protein